MVGEGALSLNGNCVLLGWRAVSCAIQKTPPGQRRRKFVKTNQRTKFTMKLPVIVAAFALFGTAARPASATEDDAVANAARIGTVPEASEDWGVSGFDAKEVSKWTNT